MTGDYLFEHALVITMEGTGLGIIADGAVCVKEDKIVAVGETAEVKKSYTAHRVISAHNKVIMPGLIDAICIVGLVFFAVLLKTPTIGWKKALAVYAISHW
ncbi:hypothetical protein JCM19037_4778 [Geomicrobium sp. JCM 19037]|uniref:amidohydrolase family protein n=1 Tax=Geomicrobium sp. JCM 19037 TaxID=1460634 RepID=UPI00045F43AD|nr:hypothetical protein JCM19037_4778 [Geomicrobium sp. JCM 19037]